MSCENHIASSRLAKSAAEQIRRTLGLDGRPYPVGIILGSGWGDALQFGDRKALPFMAIPGFKGLTPHAGHARELITGQIGGTDVVALRGRVHLYESIDRCAQDMVRLQTEMLIELGAKTLILTCSAGALTPDTPRNRPAVGDLVLIDGFFVPWQPPLEGGHGSPEDAIDGGLAGRVCLDLKRRCDRDEKDGFPLLPGGGKLRQGGYAYVRGPYYEGRKYDKPFLARSGASVVGMSVYPEAAYASLYRDQDDPTKDVRVLPVAFVTNDDQETHDHATVVSRAHGSSVMLGEFLRLVVGSIETDRR